MGPGTAGGAHRILAAIAIAIAMTAAATAVLFGAVIVHSHVEIRSAASQGPGPVLTVGSSPSTARNPQHPANVVVAAQREQPGFSAAMAFSQDGGASWTATDLPLPRGSDRPYSPEVAFAPDGTLYVLYVNLHGAGNTPEHLWLSRSDDGGRHLSGPLRVEGSLTFQPRIAIGPQGTIHITWLQGMGVGQLSLVGTPSPVMATHSTDGGTTFSPPVQVSDQDRIRVGAATPAVASDGTVLVLYEDFKGDVRDFQHLEGPVWPDPFSLVISRSTNGGESFSPGREVDRQVAATERFIAYAPVFPALATGPDGLVAVAWADARDGGSQVLLRRSSDGGSTWTVPSRIAAGARLPAAAISPSRRIDLLYLSDGHRNAAGEDSVAAVSTDAGQTFAETRLSGAAHPAVGIGSHLGLTSRDDGALAVWAQTGRAVGTAWITASGPGSLAYTLGLATSLLVAVAATLWATALLRPRLVPAARTGGASLFAGAARFVRGPIGAPSPPVTRPVSELPRLRVAGREYPVVFPSWRDPRLHVAAALLTVQLLGQVALGFQLSIAQLLLALGVCAGLELVITFAQRRMIIWPASAMLTGNGVALILRVPGTEHGDWWSLRGAEIFVLAAAISLLSKYVARIRRRHLFNPSNVGLVLCFVVAGSARADPQDLWWGPPSAGLVLTYAIVIVGGLLIVRRLRMLTMVLAFLSTFALLVGVTAAGGHCMTARWHVGPICGVPYWWTLVASPEILIFIFFMITDPQTSPRSSAGRIAYGSGIALVAALLLATQRTEFATKVAILAGLVLICALQPAVRLLIPDPGALGARLRSWTGRRTVLVPAGSAAIALFACSGLVLLATIPGRQVADPGLDLAALQARAALRPLIALDPTAIPPAQFASGVRGSDLAPSDATANRMAHDVVEDLVISSQAIQNLDPRLAATAAIAPWLATPLHDIEQSRRTGHRTVPNYRAENISMVLASNPNDYQASPEVAVEVRGTVERVTYAGLSGAVVTARVSSHFDRVFAVQQLAGHFLISADFTRS